MAARTTAASAKIYGIDLFCGAGGLTLGLQTAGIQIVAGVDSDQAAEYPFTSNNKSKFILKDIRDVSGAELSKLYPKGAIRLLAGCAPCKPFSPHRRGLVQSRRKEWSLLSEFGRIAEDLLPELITVENVPRLRSKGVFRTFVSRLIRCGYQVDFASVQCAGFGVPQTRRRLVLLASRIGDIKVPCVPLAPDEYKTVRETIGKLPRLSAGKSDPNDPLHKARSLSDKNLRRLKASEPGGSWRDWPRSLRAKCHQKKSGATYKNVYARMEWDKPAPTITTLSHNFGTGRFGHPEQNRAISLREAAMLQSFPKGFRFVKGQANPPLTTIGTLIGNAVPPRLAYFIGKELLRVATQAKDS